ncbi:MAG: hypothetical protein AB8G95_19965 [Anaerolineae bacterium]
MTIFKAYAVTCERFFPGKIVHYAALSEHGALNEALTAIYKIGGRAKPKDVSVMRVPELDKLAGAMSRTGCLDGQIMMAR